MENNIDLSVFRPRSYRACIADGYRLYVGNFRRLFRASWVVALLYALCLGLTMSTFVKWYPQLLVASSMNPEQLQLVYQHLAPIIVLVVASTLITILMQTALSSCGYQALREHQASSTISIPTRWSGRFDLRVWGRVIKSYLWTLVVGIVLALVIIVLSAIGEAFLSPIATLALISVGCLAAVLLSVPLAYIVMRYVMTPDTHFATSFWRSYVVGLRHWGGTFAVLFVVVTCLSILLLITELPANILYIANVQSQMGVMQGDPVGLPSYLGWLNFVVFAIAGFIQAYLMLSFLFPLYYLYGSIEQQERERKEGEDNKN